MAKHEDTTLTPGRFSILLQAQLHLDHGAVAAWNAHKSEHEWDHHVEKALQGAIDSHKSRATAFHQPVASVAFRHVKGGVADATAAASQLCSKAADLRVLVAYVGGPGQAPDLAALASALKPAVQGDATLCLIVGTWDRSPGPYAQWGRIFEAWRVLGADASAEPRAPHPVLDRLNPELPAL